MGAVLIPVLIVVIVVVAFGLAATRFVQREQRRTDRLRAGDSTLRYQVPNGQDPADLILQLVRAGYEVVPDATVGQSSEILIGGRGRKRAKREEVRLLLEVMSRVDAEGGLAATQPRIQFMDEQ